jgi:hypothetical protein
MISMASTSQEQEAVMKLNLTEETEDRELHFFGFANS